MPTPTQPSRLLRLLKYWIAHFSASKEAREAIPQLLSLLVGIGGAVATLLHLCGVLPKRWIESDFAAFLEVFATIGGFFYFIFWRPFVQHEEQKTRIAALEGDVTKHTTPFFEILCGDHVRDSTSRNRPVAILANGAPTGKTMDADFFGFVIRNNSADTIRKCRCDFMGLERDGKTLWAQKSPLPFAPRDREGQTEMDIRSRVDHSAALCTITEQNEILFGSLNMTWRFPEPFHSFFTEPGGYVFLVSVSGEGTPTAHARFLLSWTGKRQTSTITLLSVA
jgi:hypothetical protein